MKILLMIFVAAIAAFIPEDALAWGPGVHLALGNSVLGNLGCLPPLVAGLIARHQSAFLYGCLSADIFIGKGSSFKPGHSHNWVTGFKLLQSAKDPRVSSYAYGYLTHLAADVVAHNYYVPNSLWNMPSGGKISHVYVEAQADRRFERERESALALFRRPNKDNDSTLLSAMEKKRWPFLVKKQILKGSLKVTGSKEWGHSLRLVDRLLPWSTPNRQLDDMVKLSERLVFNFLCNPRQSTAVAFDPIGSKNLHTVRDMRNKNAGQGRNNILFAPHHSLTELKDVHHEPNVQAASGTTG
ncbi:zinc dependent phospholipase C family protein [Pseudodesulfovibrio sp. zrk46]|uniref:zinc dependent phospholipase C family protein n=1 Tax=Pseudodesulfovibrio sp. zrk46 TaxID=2725288 RepID=UPI00144A2048|nr:zinc dependent phospholipase C family protein [Pseudodesulfovibrio sp. zrk46]QJB55610.1 zinc dependent phospholipase C family protein [Pseudodesulfovibrio sp. zrk46]